MTKIDPIFLATITKGKPVLDNLPSFAEYCRAKEGKRQEVIVRDIRKKRSSNENRYYFGVVVKMISEYTGDDTDSTHEMLKLQFLIKHREGLPDTIKSTAKLTTAEFEEYLENVRRWAATFFPLYIPLPNECDY
jgi:hypothetical protein